MTNLRFPEQFAALRATVFDAIEQWNVRHPQRLGSRRERASIAVSHVYGDATGAPTYEVTVDCSLAGNARLTFHGPDLTALVEKVRLTLEHKIADELREREERAEPADGGVLV